MQKGTLFCLVMTSREKKWVRQIFIRISSAVDRMIFVNFADCWHGAGKHNGNGRYDTSDSRREGQGLGDGPRYGDDCRGRRELGASSDAIPLCGQDAGGQARDGSDDTRAG